MFPFRIELEVISQIKSNHVDQHRVIYRIPKSARGSSSSYTLGNLCVHNHTENREYRFYLGSHPFISHLLTCIVEFPGALMRLTEMESGYTTLFGAKSVWIS